MHCTAEDVTTNELRASMFGANKHTCVQFTRFCCNAHAYNNKRLLAFEFSVDLVLNLQ